jgi:hypothetical protein
MAWRVLEHAGQTWNVSWAAERGPNSSQWNLVFSFRTVDAARRLVWAPYPLSSSSKAALFAQADRLSNRELQELLAARLA